MCKSFYISSALITLILTGCGANAPYVKPNDPVLVPESKTVTIPPAYLQECANLVSPESRAYPEADVVVIAKDWKSEHSECKDNHKGLVDIVKKAFNIK